MIENIPTELTIICDDCQCAMMVIPLVCRDGVFTPDRSHFERYAEQGWSYTGFGIAPKDKHTCGQCNRSK